VTSEQERARLEDRVGHPGDRWDALHDRVVAESIRSFTAIQRDWLDLMWCLDAYRSTGIAPRGMGNPGVTDEQRRLDAIYRGKGNWFSTLCASLLENATEQRIGSRSKVQGFSQQHQIDIAWPARYRDVHVCAEAKVSGAPPQATSGARRAAADFASRRKELKFAATDLKLWRRDLETRIDHWGHWRQHANPRTFVLWGARLAVEQGETLADLVREGVALTNTYLDGVGIFAWRPGGNEGYAAVPVTPSTGIESLDAVLHHIATEINTTAQAHGGTPAVETPPARAAEEDVPYE
jgi:hypothetical protein